MKQQFMPKTQLRQDLANRQIVVRMVGIREAIANPWLRRAARDAGKSVEGCQAGDVAEHRSYELQSLFTFVDDHVAERNDP
jgi:hypothetical protein